MGLFKAWNRRGKRIRPGGRPVVTGRELFKGFLKGRAKRIRRVTPKLSPRERILAAARAELGVVESSPNWGPRISQYLAETNISFPAAWCMAFCQYVLEKAGVDIGYPGAYVPHGEQWARGAGRWTQSPTPGDLVVYNLDSDPEAEHVGIYLRSMPGGDIEAIEGNTSDGVVGSQDDGDGVYVRRRSRSLVKGYIRVAP